MIKKRLFKCLSFVTVFLVLLIGLPTICGCTSLLYIIFKPRASKLKDPLGFLKERCGIELPSEAETEYNLYVLFPKNEYSYFLVFSCPDTPKEFLGYVEKFEEMALTDEEISKFIERMEYKLERILKEVDMNIDDLDEKNKPHWDTEFITNWKKFENPYANYEVYFPETQLLLAWGTHG